jgi:hypothetical protein
MHLTNDSPSFTPVHSQIRAIGPQDLHLWKGRGRAARQLLDLICPEEAWVKLLRCRSWNSGRLSRPA